MLSDAQKAEYDRVGAIVVPDVLSPAEVAELAPGDRRLRRPRPPGHRA